LDRARALHSPKSQIRVRVLTWEKEPIDPGISFARRLSQALALRQKYLSVTTNAHRLVNGEGDFLPGLIMDRYSDFLSASFHCWNRSVQAGYHVAALADWFRSKACSNEAKGEFGTKKTLSHPLASCSAKRRPI
jgi:23S rRNA (cytosine1962-C5)-methyltransferase